MPIYEYECTQCGSVEEVIQKFSDDPLTTCKQCSGKLNKLMSQSSFHLKGSGWYVTDYANKSKKSSPSEEKHQKTASEQKTKSDSNDSKKSYKASEKKES